MKLRLSNRARQDLDAIFEYSCAQFGEDRALNYIDEIVSSLQQLTRFPKSGHRSHRLLPNRRVSRIRSHYAVYTIEDHTVHVLAIAHERQLPDSL